ncbi:MAG: hypothetical protein CVU65_11770 [Deltaproteobacteria bacterium HGW-Deltaproteobacteria-22]|nr:MAG: hypothetical protein CVU65_11770 [Deltaproteobacteria bacterium HGW-Deltaproteobacteria-22]
MIAPLLFCAAMALTVPEELPPEGLQSRFSFGIGTQVGLGNQGTAGLIGSLRFHGIAGLDLEYDFNRVTSTPSISSREVEDLKFTPNFKIEGVVHFFRDRKWSPFAVFGLGIDLGADFNRTNMIGGVGVEFPFFANRVVFALGFRLFVPRPADVEKQRERRLMDGNPVLPAYTDYYNFDQYQITMSVRVYY